ncbi:MAG: hypothetical protein MJ249_07400 [Kiritimatiellae bacterium]|nr:hypothetical protein [Kiritimatiellia bacterium]
MNTVKTVNDNLLRALATRLGAMGEAAAPTESSGQTGALESAILKGPALTISDIRAQIRGMAALHSTQAMVAMMNSVYQTMKDIVDNLAPSDEERLEKERRMEELEKLRRRLEDKEVTLEEAARNFENIAIAAADRALLDANMATEAQPKA